MTAGTGCRREPAARTPHDDSDAVQALVEEHLGLVRRIARRHAPRGEDVDDLFQEGAVGLLKAFRRFDPDRGVPFRAYAAIVVEGEIRHHLRDSSCAPLPDLVPLEHDVPTTATGFGRSDDRADLEARLSLLEPREREIVYLRFFADLTQDEIARCLGISQMHVSRLLRGALVRLRTVGLGAAGARPP